MLAGWHEATLFKHELLLLARQTWVSASSLGHMQCTPVFSSPERIRFGAWQRESQSRPVRSSSTTFLWSYRLEMQMEGWVEAGGTVGTRQGGRKGNRAKPHGSRWHDSIMPQTNIPALLKVTISISSWWHTAEEQVPPTYLPQHASGLPPTYPTLLCTCKCSVSIHRSKPFHGSVSHPAHGLQVSMNNENLV